MKVLFDSLFYVGQIVSLAALAYGAWLVLRESLADNFFPQLKKYRAATSLAASFMSPSRRITGVVTGNPGCR